MKLLNLFISTAVGVLPLCAKADFLCANADQTIKVQTYELSGVEGVDFTAQKAAAILKIFDEKTVATGMVGDVPNRVGGWKVFSLVDNNDQAVGLTTITTFDLLPCTRAGCPAALQITKGTLKKDGETYALICSANSF